MTGARGLKAVRSWVNALSLTEEVIVVAGVIFFFVGLATSAMLIRIGFLAASSSLIAYVVVTRARENKVGSKEYDTTSSPGDAVEETSSSSKKLVFDDFQDSRKPYKVESAKDSPNPQPLIIHMEKSPMAQPERVPHEPPYDFQVADFFESHEDEANREQGPKAEFSYLVKKVLTVIKEVNFAHTVALFWVNREKNQLVMESFVSDSEHFTTHRRRELGQDLVSQVALNGKPQMLNSLNVASRDEMLPYYDSTETVKTFVGVPIFYSRSSVTQQEPVAVLTVDCRGEDAYGSETLALLGQFTKLISALIQSYTDKYDLLLDSEVLRSITRFREQLKIDFSTHNIVRSLAEEASRLVPWDYISVVVFDESRKSWVVQHVMNRMNDPYVPIMSDVDPHQSIAGSVIQSCIPKIVDNVSGLGIPRFYQAERCDSNGSLLAVPLNSLSRCYGALVVENKDPRTYSDADVKLVQKVSESGSWALEILSLTDVANNFVSLDETTGVATRKYFLERVQEEVQRANDFGSEVSIVMLAIDSMNDHLSRYGRDAFDFVLQNVGHMIKSATRPYDVVGRFDFNRFGMLLVNTTPNEASLWAEKLRKNVASNIINVDGKSFSVTISIGVSGAPAETNDVELLENADRVLKKAVEAGGNVVRVF